MTQRQIIRTTGQLLAAWQAGDHNLVIRELANLGQNYSAHLMMTIAVGICSVLGDYERGRFYTRVLEGYPNG